MAEFLATPLGTFLLILAQGLGIIAFVMLSLLFLVYGDRKIWAAVQMRRGPNVVGAFGLLRLKTFYERVHAPTLGHSPRSAARPACAA